MERRHRRWTHWPLIVLIAVLVAFCIAVLMVPASSAAGRAVQLLFGVVPASFALWQYSYTHIESHRLRVNRARLWLTNPEVSWGLDAEFDVASGTTALVEARRCLVERMADQDAVLSETDQSLVAQMAGVTLRLTALRAEDPFESIDVLRLDVPSASRSWRGWQSFVDREMPRLLEEIERATSPSARKYTVEIAFARENPYFGLFVHQVPETSLTRFDIEYFEGPDRTGAVIRVHRHRIQITTDSLQSSRVLSMQYLALEPAGGRS